MFNSLAELLNHSLYLIYNQDYIYSFFQFITLEIIILLLSLFKRNDHRLFSSRDYNTLLFIIEPICSLRKFQAHYTFLETLEATVK
jgi:hypothetical protein